MVKTEALIQIPLKSRRFQWPLAEAHKWESQVCFNVVVHKSVFLAHNFHLIYLHANLGAGRELRV